MKSQTPNTLIVSYLMLSKNLQSIIAISFLQRNFAMAPHPTHPKKGIDLLVAEKVNSQPSQGHLQITITDPYSFTLTTLLHYQL